ncbi:MAG: DegT/DnrJ/EryC1/StrS aminotransferase family protein [Gammaproteobacteria bacterium]
MTEPFIPFARPAIGKEEIEAVVDTLRSDWITTGPKTQKFTEALRDYLGAAEVLSLNSCTAALHTALVTWGIGPGDEVITTPMTFAASVNVIEHVGAKPVLVDVQPDTLNIDPENIKAAITAKTRAIIPVHYTGHPADLDEIDAIAKSHRLHVLEDAAHAIPARYRGKMIGSGTNPVAFSFYATKNLTTAEGGALTGPQDFLEKARVVSLHGMSRDAWKRYGEEGSWFYEVVLPGFKYNMTDIQAALGLCQLHKLEMFQRRRRDIVQKYNQAFAQSELFQIPTTRSYVEHAWHLYVLRLNLDAFKINRDQFIEELKASGIGTSVHFIPVHLHPFYRDKYGYTPVQFPVTYGNYQRMLSLPLYPTLSDAEVTRIIGSIQAIARKYRR